MRSVELSENRVIEFLNENFINTWVTNSELGRSNSLRDPIQRRREREGKTVNTNHHLAQAIMKGWKQGSPVDCFVISHDFELMGSVEYNEFSQNIGEFDDDAEAYLFFLQESLDGKRPGLCDVILTPEKPTERVLDTFYVPVKAHEDYTVVFIDTTEFENGGKINIELRVGRGKAIGIFHLLTGEKKLPSVEPPDGVDPDEWYNQQSSKYKKAIGALTQCWGVFPDQTGKITYEFDKRQRFKLCATGDQWGGIGGINAFEAIITVEEVE